MTRKNPLQIIAVEKNDPSFQKSPRTKTSREEVQAHFERMWRQNPHQFNPLRSCAERERLQRTSLLIQKHISLKEKKIADLG
ncbi:MAG TPA: class I SAM-dependent methyltransferase, partial [Waddliaceae bacterium]